ncbi:MAG: thioredoxin domain-containing protein [Candidatus Hermodarchaeota archaeon]|nr:thioredoxin domain-containing protein [Candidatus Hermodarchaeota archaeon]
MVEELTDDTIEDFIKEHEVVILDIYTVWCGPCKMQAAILADLGKGLDAKRVVIAKLDADQAPITSQKYQIRAIPTLILFKDGNPVKTHVGVWPREEIENELAAIL